MVSFRPESRAVAKASPQPTLPDRSGRSSRNFLVQNLGLAHAAVQPLLPLLLQILSAHPGFHVLAAHLFVVVVARWVTFRIFRAICPLHIHFHIHFWKAREVRVPVRDHVALACNNRVNDVSRENGQLRGEVWLRRTLVQRGPELTVHNVLVEEQAPFRSP